MKWSESDTIALVELYEKHEYIWCNMHILLRNNNTHIPESYKEKRTKNNYCTHKL
jgi:hypothetical protein